MKKGILIVCLSLSTTLVGCSHPVKFKKLLPKKYANFLGKDNETNKKDEGFITSTIKKLKDYKEKINDEELKEKQIEADIKKDIIISKFIKSFEFNRKALIEAQELDALCFIKVNFKDNINSNNYNKNVEKYNKFLLYYYKYENKTGDKNLDNLLFYLDKYNKIFMKNYCAILFNNMHGYDKTCLIICEAIIKDQREYINKLKDYIKFGNIDFNLEKGIEFSKELIDDLEKEYEDNEKKYYDFVRLTFSKGHTIKLQYVEEYKINIRKFKEISEKIKENFSVKSLDPILKSIVERCNRVNYNFKKAYVEIFDVDRIASNNAIYNIKKFNDCQKYLEIQERNIRTLKFLMSNL